ncbi:phage tail domain-containing protein [Bacillus atrophaeus]|uniref:phage tail domain-containing protein n=1 Tax=Bacillus atrophaeus TaxID=1452 RepID=UPI00255B9BA2|nr:phage tail domain-containing protein [Bacillus atrophaeus]MDL5141131.1 phage tail family protein [Bacillus atrophaeus]
MIDVFYLDFLDGQGSKSLNSRLPYFNGQKFEPESPNIEWETITLQRTNGVVIPTHPRDIVYKPRTITVTIFFNSIIDANFYQWRQELFALLVRPRPYYISSNLLPNRRFLVTCGGQFSIPKPEKNNATSFTVNFTNITGVAESVQRSIIPQNLSGENWNVGMNLDDRDDREYFFEKQKTFQVYNPGNVMINTMEHDYNVTFNGTGKNISIINHTSGEKVTINQEIKKSQSVTNVRQYLVVNNTRLKTSGRIPGLDVGINKFEILNCDDFTIKFDTRFYYS